MENHPELTTPRRYFVKGDISGIQSFVFNIKSERAAKALKSRSFFVSALARAAIRRIERTPGVRRVEEIFEGGGNFYLLADSDSDDFLSVLMQDVQEAFRRDDLYLSLSAVPVPDNADFGALWKELNHVSQLDRLRHFHDDLAAFLPFDRKKQVSQQAWAAFTTHIVAAQTAQWQSAEETTLKMDKNTLRILQEQMTLTTTKGKETQPLTYRMPRYTPQLLRQYESATRRQFAHDDQDDRPYPNNLISFHYLAAFAKQRSGSDKLGVLKMDLDNLGKIFEQPGSLTDKKALSAQLRHFFSAHLSELLQNGTFQYLPPRQRRGQSEFLKEAFGDHVYTVFAGGDDCFFIGGWDAVFEWALFLREAFMEYGKKHNLPSLTFSAGLIAVHDKFPVVRMAELTEEALRVAKTHCQPGETTPTKDKINVLGETLTWEEFKKAARYADQLEHLIKVEGRSRNVLGRLKNLAYGYDRLQRRVVEEGTLQFTTVSRMAFYLGKLRGESKWDRNNKSAQQTTDDLLHDCQKALLDAGMKGKSSLNPMVFPVAARWAELRCRAGREG